MIPQSPEKRDNLASLYFGTGCGDEMEVYTTTFALK